MNYIIEINKKEYSESEFIDYLNDTLSCDIEVNNLNPTSCVKFTAIGIEKDKVSLDDIFENKIVYKVISSSCVLLAGVFSMKVDGGRIKVRTFGSCIDKIINMYHELCNTYYIPDMRISFSM